MRRHHGSSLALALGFSGLVAVATPACSSDAQGPADTGFEIKLAPLQLPGVTNLCAKVTVFNTTDPGLMDAAHTVWSEDYVCADQYGDSGGSLTYIGTCDASGGTPTTPAQNTVELEIQAILVDGSDAAVDNPMTPWNETTTHKLSHPGDFFDPCQNHGCRIQKPCVENQDTLVEFKLTVMRSANQGFFDVAVNFSDVFCSAKFDCQYNEDKDGDLVDDAIRLLFDETGTRGDTAILAFACTAGSESGLESADTHLYMEDIVVTCSNDLGYTVYTETFSPSDDADPDDNDDDTVFGPGNQVATPRPLVDALELQCQCEGDIFAYGCATDAQCDDEIALRAACDDICQAQTGANQNALSPMTCAAAPIGSQCQASVVFQWAVYEGVEFPDGGVDFQKSYWNVAFGFNLDAMAGLECTLHTRATASNGPLDGNATTAGASYPYLTYDINLNDPESPGTGLTCGQNPVGPQPVTVFVADSGVRPRYTELPDQVMTFAHCGHADGGSFGTHNGSCTPVPE